MVQACWFLGPSAAHMCVVRDSRDIWQARFRVGLDLKNTTALQQQKADRVIPICFQTVEATCFLAPPRLHCHFQSKPVALLFFGGFGRLPQSTTCVCQLLGGRKQSRSRLETRVRRNTCRIRQQGIKPQLIATVADEHDD